MLISFIELQNFRKLKSVHIDLDEKQTLLVGANNSGKTSAMVALGHFLVNPKRFSTNDFTLSNWSAIDAIGKAWEASIETQGEISTEMWDWDGALPSLDLWIKVEPNEIHHVRHLIPTLDWDGEMLGVRLRYEPEKPRELAKEYLAAFKAASETKKASAGRESISVNLWPTSLKSYLDRRLNSAFCRRAYLLDPSKLVTPDNGIAQPQPLDGLEPSEIYPLDGLIRIDEIAAQRGLGDSTSGSGNDGEDSDAKAITKRLSSQLRTYYDKHLNPYDYPEVDDLKALQAIEEAQKAYDARLEEGFKNPLDELRMVNYPGVTDPVLKIATRLRPTDGLSHNAAVQYEVAPSNDKSLPALSLPEEFNGLGYQNLISMMFRLMSFRDAWMRVGKASKTTSADHFHPPLHLVIVEEPEAHLHVQVQQVFVRQAYGVLRNHKDLGGSKLLCTQLVVSTHSSHVAHECDFSCLRYFRRIPASDKLPVPTAAVVNLTEVFGTADETARFVERYLQATHCDLFFADAAILVEGPAERMLVPHFIRNGFTELHRCYVTLLEIGGSHAHRLRPLIESLGLLTLVITDIDAAEATGHHKVVPPERGKGLISRNTTLTDWHPSEPSLDKLLDLDAASKEFSNETPLFAVRVAYQTPAQIEIKPTESVELLSTTFEDALVIANTDYFKKTDSTDGQTKKFKDAIDAYEDGPKFTAALFEIVRDCDKARFALDLLWEKNSEKLKAPAYIHEGLEWLQNILVTKLDIKTQATPLADRGGAK